MNRIEALGRISEELGYRSRQLWHSRTHERKRKEARAAFAAAYVVFCEERARVFGDGKFLRMAEPHQDQLWGFQAEGKTNVKGFASLVAFRSFLENAPTDQLVEYVDQLTVTP